MQEGSAVASDSDLELLRSGIRLMALRALGDPDAAEEVAQESLTRALEVIRCPEKTTNLSAYIAGIARHVIADRFRANAQIVSLDRVALDGLKDETADVLTALCLEDDASGVRTALAELSSDDRDLLRLCFFEGLSPTDVATRMNMPPERIRQRKLRALQRLRNAFEGRAHAGHDRRPTPSVNVSLSTAAERGSAK